MAVEKQLVGITGVYFVAAELSQRNRVALITTRNTRGIDVLVCNKTAKKIVALQVKTNWPGDSKTLPRYWLLGENDQYDSSPNKFYVLVGLNDNARPDYYLVPSKIVSTRIRRGHHRWLGKKARNGEAHNDSSMRKFFITAQDSIKYKDNWKQLGL